MLVDWLQTIISACAAVGAISAAIVTWWVYRDSRKPDVYAYFEIDLDRAVTAFVIKNFGESVAFDVCIDDFRFEALPVSSFREKAKTSFISSGVPMLVPGACRETIIGRNRELSDVLNNCSMTVTVRFSGKSLTGAKRSYVNECVLDNDSYMGSIHTNSLMYTIARAQAKIAGISM